MVITLQCDFGGECAFTLFFFDFLLFQTKIYEREDQQNFVA